MKIRREKVEKVAAQVTTALKAGPLQKEGLAERRAALEQKKAEREARQAKQGEKAAALVAKLQPDLAAERRLAR